MVLLLVPGNIVFVTSIDASERGPMVRPVGGGNDVVEVLVGDDLVARNTHHGLAGALLEDLVNPLVLLLRSFLPVEVIRPRAFDDGFSRAERLRIDTH